MGGQGVELEAKAGAGSAGMVGTRELGEGGSEGGRRREMGERPVGLWGEIMGERGVRNGN
jgi:hypothetical protein